MATPPPKKDIVIIGAGIIGSTTAYYLTRHPHYSPSTHTITLLEASSIAAGASGKAGGLLALWAYPRCLVPLSFRLHKELAAEHGGEGRWGYRGVGVGSLEVEGRKVPGWVGVKGGGEGRKEEVRGVHDQSLEGSGDGNVSLMKRGKESYGGLRTRPLPEDLDWVDEGAVTGWDKMGDERDTAQVHPYQFTTSMADLAMDKGAKVVYGRCTGIDSKTDTKKVMYTDKNTGEEKVLEATDVVVTAGPWTKDVLKGAPIGNTRAHSVTIRPSRPVSAYCLFTQISLPRNFKDDVKSKAMHVTPEIYARPNNELYACGEGDHLVALPKTADEVKVDAGRCQDIVDYCASFSDEMRDGEVLVRQACYLPLVETGGGPLIGSTSQKGVYLAAGHTCWGIQNGPATGKVMSEIVMDGVAKSASVGSLDPRTVMR